MTDLPVLVDRADAVTTITLNRADRRNALTVDFKEVLRDVIAEAAVDKDARAVVLAAVGPAFCVGQDLAEHAEGLKAGAQQAFATVRDHYSPVVRDLMTMPKPVIAAVAGTCVGAGLGLALACDYRVFAAGTKLGTAFSGIGLTFDTGLSYTLPRAVGDARARELILFSRIFDAEQAVQWGIAGEVVAQDEVVQRALSLAHELAQGPTTAFAASKELVLASADRGLDDALEAEALAQTRCGETADHDGAVTAFLGRQKPSFVGR